VYQTVLAIQAYLTVAAFSVLALSAVLAERSRIEAAGSRSEANYRTLFKSATDGVMVMQRHQLVDCNDKILEVLNLPRDEIIGKTPWELSPTTQADGQDSEKKARKITRGLQRGETDLFEWRHLKGGGGTVDFEVGVAAAEVIDGEPMVFSHLRDITERKRVQQQLQDRLRFETLLSDLSAKLVHVPPEHVDEILTDSLRSLVENLDLDRGSIFQGKAADDLIMTHFWSM
jgi:PAS domain S-box-containing protein